MESRKILKTALSFGIFPFVHEGIKPLLSKQSSATLPLNLYMSILIRSNIEYSAGRNIGLELEDLDSRRICYLLDFREVT